MEDRRILNLSMFLIGAIIIWISIVINQSNLFIGYFLTYIGIVAVTLAIPDWKFLKWVKAIILIPAGILMLIGPLNKVFLAFVMAYIMPLATIALFFKYIPLKIFNLDLSYAANAYLVLTISLIFVTIYGEKLIRFFNGILNDNNPEKLVNNYSELALHLMNRSRTKYFIFFMFFCYIIVYSVASLNDIEIFEIKNTNVAIMQTFGTYIAFDRLISNKDLFVFKPKDFLLKLTTIWRYDFSYTQKEEDMEKERKSE